MKKLLAITLSVCIMICVLSISAFAASDPYDDVDAAIAAIGLKSLADKVDQESIYGNGSNSNEAYYMLFDDDVTTKFGTGEFPAYAAWKMDKAYSIGGIIFATANDNASYVGRNPDNWVLKGSHDDSTWVDIANGTYDDLEDTDYTYYTVKFDKPTEAYEYFMFEVDQPAVGTFFQMSELVLCEADEAPAPVETPAEPEPEAPAETPAEEVEVAPVETAAPVSVATTTAPATFDALTVIAIASVIALAGFAVSKKTVR